MLGFVNRAQEEIVFLPETRQNSAFFVLTSFKKSFILTLLF